MLGLGPFGVGVELLGRFQGFNLRVERRDEFG